MLVSVALSLYILLLIWFGLVSHPLIYCLLLVGCSLCLSFLTVFLWGFSWYLVLFVLVYVGGVYVLFLYVSVHSPNSYITLGGSTIFYLVSFFLFFLFFYLFLPASGSIEECSRFLCSGVEGFSYVLLCMSLLLGFVGISVVCGQKDSFFR